MYIIPTLGPKVFKNMTYFEIVGARGYVLVGGHFRGTFLLILALLSQKRAL